MFKEKKILLDTTYLTMSTLINVLFSYYFIYYFAKFLTIKEYGVLALALTLTSIISGIAIGGLSIGIGRYYSIAKRKNNLESYLRASRFLCVISCFIIFITVLIFIYFIKLDILNDIKIRILFLALIYSILFSLNNALISIQNAIQERKYLSLLSSLDSVLKLILPILLVSIINDNYIEYILIGMLFSITIVLSLRYIYLKKKLNVVNLNENSRTRTLVYCKKIFLFSIPFIIWGIFGWLQQSSIKWFLGVYGSIEDVAIYSILYQISYTPLVMIFDIIISISLPIMYNNINNYKNLITKKYILLLLIVILSYLIFYNNLKFFIPFIGLEKYSEYVTYSIYLFISAVIFISSQILATVFFVHKKTKPLLYPSIISSLFGIIAAYYFILLKGLIGAIYASIFHSVVYFLLMVITYIGYKNVFAKN